MVAETLLEPRQALKHSDLTGVSAVLADIEAGEDALSLAKAAHLPILKVDGKGPNPSTLWRWITSGVRAKSGAIVKLPTAKLGGVNVVTASTVRRFLDAVNDPLSPGAGASAGQVKRQHAAATKQLDEALGAV